MIRLLLLLLLSSCAGFAAASEPILFGPGMLQPSGEAERAVMAPAAAGTVPAAPAVAVPVAAATDANQAPAFDYSANLASDVFGAQLFSGRFAREGAARFNPDYAIAVGDRVQIRLWGGFEHDSIIEVDPKGNLFLPHVGPVQVLGVRNEDLQRVVEAAVARVFRANVYSYASLAAAQPVRIYVSGFVNRPGLYDGTSMDSLLHYLDQAGGIDPERGSFLGVQVKRGETVRAEVSLYEFLLEGRMPLVQLADGDVIFVAARRNVVAVSGLAQNARRFEFATPELSVAALARLARPMPEATHARVVRNTGSVQNVEYYSLDESESVALVDGDRLEFTADKKPGTITVRVEGEHQSAQEYVLPYGTRMGDLIGRIQFSERSDVDSLQLFRRSVKERQKQMLQTALKSLETAALTARSGTSDEARLRTDEANLLLRWVDRAREIEPLGQVMMVGSANRDQLLLENGDVLRVPVRDGLVLISGEVLFPNAIAWEEELDLEDYVDRAGGFTQNADVARIVIAHRNGSFEEAAGKSGLFSKEEETNVVPGDEILVLPKIDVKSRQIWKDLTQILYQIAVSAKVVVDL